MTRTIYKKTESPYLRGLLTFIPSLLLALLYSALIALIGSHLRGALIAFPIWIVLLWYAYWKWNLLRFTGYLAIVPVSILAFEIVRTLINPPIYAHDAKVLDRSHYKRELRAYVPKKDRSIPDGRGWGLKGVLIGKDGFRADPATGEENPKRCSLALIGDSMIFGSGLPYSDTLRPTLASMGADACVFGVSGNMPLGYLATLKYVEERIEKEGHIAIYIYVYNDFVSFSKYLRRSVRAVSSSFGILTKLIIYFDQWRQTTYTRGLFRKKRKDVHSLPLWELKIRKGNILKFYYSHDPATYDPPPRLNAQKRATLKYFFEDLREIIGDRRWRVSIMFIPDNPEMMVNFARQTSKFQDLDQRRIDALKMCHEIWSSCEDLGPYLYTHTLAEGKNPYFIDNRHFSAFGTRLVAEHYLKTVQKTLSRPAAN